MVLDMIITILVDLIADPISKYVVTPITRNLSYAFKCNSNVEKLHHQVEQLNNRRLRLQQSVDEANRNGEEIYSNVKNWLDTAYEDIGEAEKLIQGKEEAKKKCFNGLCPNLKTRYQLSKKAHKKSLAISYRLQDAERFDQIAFLPPLQQITEPSMYSREALPSRVLILNRIMDALKDPSLNMIGVYGMGGVGKTTLAKEIQRKATEEKLFETVVLVFVSQKPDLRTIQGDIGDFLGMKFEAEGVPGRASQLYQRLKAAKVLIILDNVWQKLDLYAVGVPSSEGCKVLLTSRRKDILSTEMHTQKDFFLDVLKEEETRRLFELLLTKASDPELGPTATKIAKKCAGLPLLIHKVTTDLQNKDSYAWNDMLTRLSSLENTDIYEMVHKVIESSYEKLRDEEAKSLFLIFPLFGNCNIRIHDLLMCSMGLGLFKNVNTVEGARNRILSLIDKLKNENLLLDGDKVGFVKIHDFLRDIAVAIASRKQHAFISTNRVTSRDLASNNCTVISLPYCEISELPQVLECPEAKLFSLFSEDLTFHIPDSFFEQTTKLKVVLFKSLDLVSGLPSSLGFLACLHTLSLQSCKLKNVAAIAELTQLEILSFSDSDIQKLPGEIAALTRLKLLDLRSCSYLTVIPANLFSNLRSLEELYMLDSFVGWEEDGNASLVELKCLSRLTTLEIQVLDDKLLPQDWFFSGLQNYRLLIGKHWKPNMFSTSESSRILNLELKTSIGLMDKIKDFMRGTEVLYLDEVKGFEKLLFHNGARDSNCSLEKIQVEPFWKLQILNIWRCDVLKDLFSYSSVICFQKLRELGVRQSKNMEAIVGEWSEDEVIEFPYLTALNLYNLPHLRGFCRTTRMVVSFPNLTSMEVYGCDSLKYVFTTSTVKSLKQLKNLGIIGCKSMEEIILSEEIEEGSINRIVFPRLDKLSLERLVNLKRFINGRAIRFSSMKELNIEQCSAFEAFVSRTSNIRSNNGGSTDEYFFNEMVTLPNLEKMFLREIGSKYIWHPEFNEEDSFSKLRSLRIENLPTLKHIWSNDAYLGASTFENLQSVFISCCEDLKYAFPASVAGGLVQLQQLVIYRCGIELIVAMSENKGSEGTKTHTFQWPELKRFEVYGCPNLMKFGPNIPGILTQGSSYSFPKVISNVEEMTLDHHSFEAIQCDALSDGLFCRLIEVSFLFVRAKCIPFLKTSYSLGLLTIKGGSLGEIFSLDDVSVGDKHQHYHRRLKQLKLDGVRDLRHLLIKDFQLDPILQHLQILNVKYCDDLVDIAPSTVSFQNLTTLNVEDCKNMTSLVTASTAKTMVNLMQLRVSGCYLMEEIVTQDSICEERDTIIFEKLQHLTLLGLDRLDSFCSGKYTFSFPLLEQVSIRNCHQMKIFCSGILTAPPLKVVYDLEQPRERDLNAIVSCRYTERVGIDNCERL